VHPSAPFRYQSQGTPPPAISGFFERSVYVNPEDGQNLNRAFPGQADGRWSQRFAHHLQNDVVVHFDRAMDMHAGDMVEALEPFLGFRLTNNTEVGRRSREMIDAHGGARWVTVYRHLAHAGHPLGRTASTDDSAAIADRQRMAAFGARGHLTDVTSPAGGIILFTLTSPAIKRDGLLVAVGVPED
jgi:hypothetical protein